MMQTTLRRSAVGLAAILLIAGCRPDGDSSPQGLTGDTVGVAMPSAIALRVQPRMQDAETGRDPQLVHTTIGDSVRLEVIVQVGDQINAFQPPILTTDNGRRLVLRGSAITADSAYFTTPVTLTVERTALPIRGRLVTSYCRAGEKLCRSATQDVVID
jgi:hypothetical protein